MNGYYKVTVFDTRAQYPVEVYYAIGSMDRDASVLHFRNRYHLASSRYDIRVADLTV